MLKALVSQGASAPPSSAEAPLEIFRTPTPRPTKVEVTQTQTMQKSGCQKIKHIETDQLDQHRRGGLKWPRGPGVHVFAPTREKNIIEKLLQATIVCTVGLSASLRTCNI